MVIYSFNVTRVKKSILMCQYNRRKTTRVERLWKSREYVIRCINLKWN